MTLSMAQGRVGLPGMPGGMSPGLGGGMGIPQGMAANSPRIPQGNPLHLRDHLAEPQASKNLLDMLGKSQAERGRPFPPLGQPGGCCGV